MKTWDTHKQELGMSPEISYTYFVDVTAIRKAIFMKRYSKELTAITFTSALIRNVRMIQLVWDLVVYLREEPRWALKETGGLSSEYMAFHPLEGL